MKPLAAGQLIHRITIEQRQVTQNPTFGGKDETWTDFKRRWANVDFSKGSEKVESDKVSNTINATVTMRYLKTLTDDMRISYGGVDYEILSVTHDFQKRFHIVLVRNIQ